MTSENYVSYVNLLLSGRLNIETTCQSVAQHIYS